MLPKVFIEPKGKKMDNLINYMYPEKVKHLITEKLQEKKRCRMKTWKTRAIQRVKNGN